MICTGGPLLIRAWMQQVAALKRNAGIEVVWVTSGAIAMAVDRTGFQKRNRLLSEKQALSAIGQPMIMDLYNIGLQTQGLQGAQILLTSDDLADPVRLGNFKNSLEQLLKWDVTPILNENDAVATEEIKFGDNDSLSAQVAACIQADRLVILTDVEGLYDENPKVNPNAQLIRDLDSISPQLLSSTEMNAGSQRGTGGMYSKLKAASLASRHGVETWLAKGDIPSVLISISEDQPIGTRIKAQRKNSPRKKIK